MARITYEENGKWYIRLSETEPASTIADRLAAYENTGLEPEELMALLQNIKAITAHLPCPAPSSDALEAVRIRPWQTLNLSTRAYHCINYMHRRDDTLPDVKTIGDLADMHHLDAYRIRQCGPGTRKEIASALQNAGVEKSDWFTFLHASTPKAKHHKPATEDTPQPHDKINNRFATEILETYLGDPESKAIWQGWPANVKGNVSMQLACLELQGLLDKEENIAKLRSAFQNDPFLLHIYEQLEAP